MVDLVYHVVRELVLEFGPKYEHKIDYCKDAAPPYLPDYCIKAPEIPRSRLRPY